MLLLRIWFGVIMIFNGRFIFTYSQDIFWHDYFKETIHFPFPDFMFYAAKGAEFFGGSLLLLGFLTRTSAGFLAFTMLIATLFANIQNIYGGFGSITLSYFLFSLIFIFEKPHTWSIDHWLSTRKNKRDENTSTGKDRNSPASILFAGIRIWFASLLIINGYHSVINNKSPIFFNWIFQQKNAELNDTLYWTILIIQIMSGLFILIRSFSKVFGRIVALSMLFIIISSVFNNPDFGGYNFLMTCILFWFGCVFSFDAVYKPTTQSYFRIATKGYNQSNRKAGRELK
ncbi:MAG TPA: DoxX family protein [Puia sp.]|nr:DoxX family protein [Puia sp.]